MKHFASLALLLTFAAAQVVFAEDPNAKTVQKKQPPKGQHVTSSNAAVHNAQINPKGVYNPNLHKTYNSAGVPRNPHLYGPTKTINPNLSKIEQQNIANANANALKHTGQNWKNDKWQANANWKYNQARWENYRNFDRRHHDHSWWHSHYSRFAVFAGGYYYWNNGFWYPAYGYDPYYNSYAYDAPIYAYNDQNPGQVIADVQNALAQAGYDPGPVDGSYGPATRDALLRYQTDNGLPRSGEIDQATMESLGLQ
ncbi:MAG: peptidoglycan-binding domain-containing protein [Chthoniobacterales bacterium]